LDAYKAGTRAYKEALERQGLTIDKVMVSKNDKNLIFQVDETMDSIHEAIQDANDIDEALREGFGSMPIPASHVDDTALEEELNAIMSEENITKRRELSLPSLPEVPKERVQEDDVVGRLRRLREGAI
jgi:hypothetical protein